MARILKYRGGGMAPDSAASRLAKMMQSYRNGGYVYAENGDEVDSKEKPKSRKQQERALYEGGKRIPEGLGMGDFYFDPEAGSFYSVVSSNGEPMGRPITETAQLMGLVERAAEERGGLDRPENVFGYVTKGDVVRERGADDPLLQLEESMGYGNIRQNPFAYASSYANREGGYEGGAATKPGFQSSIKRILGEAIKSGDAEEVSRIMGTIMNPEFSDVVPGLTPATYEGTGFKGYFSGDDLMPTRETKTVEPRTQDLLNYLAGDRRGPGSFPGQ